MYANNNIKMYFQPSYSLELTLYFIFMSLIFIFTILGIYKLTTYDDEIVILIKLNKFQEVSATFLMYFTMNFHGL